MAAIAAWMPETSLPEDWPNVRDGAFGPDVELLHAIAEALGLPEPAEIVAAGVRLALREDANLSHMETYG